MLKFYPWQVYWFFQLLNFTCENSSITWPYFEDGTIFLGIPLQKPTHPYSSHTSFWKGFVGVEKSWNWRNQPQWPLVCEDVTNHKLIKGTQIMYTISQNITETKWLCSGTSAPYASALYLSSKCSCASHVSCCHFQAQMHCFIFIKYVFILD